MMISNDERARRKAYYEFNRPIANDSVVRSAERLDHITLFLGAGTLALSIGIFGDLQAPTGFAGWLLLASWGALTLAVILHALSYRESISHNTEKVRRLDRCKSRDFENPDYEVPTPRWYYREHSGGRTVIDVFSFRAMLIGLLLLASALVPHVIGDNHEEEIEKDRPTSRGWHYPRTYPPTGWQ